MLSKVNKAHMYQLNVLPHSKMRLCTLRHKDLMVFQRLSVCCMGYFSDITTELDMWDEVYA